MHPRYDKEKHKFLHSTQCVIMSLLSKNRYRTLLFNNMTMGQLRKFVYHL